LCDAQEEIEGVADLEDTISERDEKIKDLESEIYRLSNKE
jgi:cell division protein FtsL